MFGNSSTMLKSELDTTISLSRKVPLMAFFVGPPLCRCQKRSKTLVVMKFSSAIGKK